MYIIQRFHLSDSLMVIHNCNFFELIVLPSKHNSALIMNTGAENSFEVAESFSNLLDGGIRRSAILRRVVQHTK